MSDQSLARIAALEAALKDAIRAMSSHGLYRVADRAKAVLEAAEVPGQASFYGAWEASQ